MGGFDPFFKGESGVILFRCIEFESRDSDWERINQYTYV